MPIQSKQCSRKEQRLLNVEEAAGYLGITSWTVRRLVWRGELPSVPVGRCVRIDRKDLDDFIQRQKSRNGEPR
jgi:putative molybdopterin biosynthesis protein